MKSGLVSVLSSFIIAFNAAGFDLPSYDVKSDAVPSYSEEKDEYEFITKKAKNEDDSEYLIIAGMKKVPEELVIPSEIDGIPVKEIADNAFQFNGTIKKLIIPDGVRKVGYAAFAECTALQSAVIPNSVADISAASFHDTPWLAKKCEESEFVTAGDKVLILYNGEDEEPELPYGIKKIGREAFYGNSSVKKIKIPEGVECIDRYAFADCVKLENVIIASDTEEICDFAFWNCGLKKISVPKSVKKIGVMALGYYIDTKSKYTGPVSSFEITGYMNTTAEWYATENAFLFREFEDKYDINGDCESDPKDLLYLKKLIFTEKKNEDVGEDEYSPSDLNENGKTDVFDLIRAKRVIVGR